MRGLQSILSLFRNEFNKLKNKGAQIYEGHFYVRRIGMYLYKYRFMVPYVYIF